MFVVIQDGERAAIPDEGRLQVFREALQFFIEVGLCAVARSAVPAHWCATRDGGVVCARGAELHGVPVVLDGRHGRV